MARLKSEGTDKSNQIQLLEERLEVVKQDIQSTQESLIRLNQSVMDAIHSIANQGALTFPQLLQDSRGLATQGAILSFVNAKTRLNAIETCEGNVQLNYFDDEGRMRQTLYDATSDSLNITFEQWIPDSLRACLNFNHESSVVKPETPIHLKENFTLEAWFVYPFTEELHWRILATSEDDQQQIVVYNSNCLGLRINGLFFDCGYDLENLSSGWHHLTITSKEAQQNSHVYIDGEKLGTAQAKPILTLNSMGDSITLPAMNVDYSLGFTIEAWVYYESFNQSQIIAFGTNSSSAEIIFGNKSNTATLLFTIGGHSVEAPEVLETGQWMHLAATVDDSGNVVLYKNGQSVASATSSALSNINRTQNLIGKLNDGEIAEVRLWNYPRPQTELQGSLGKVLNGDELGLVGYWQFTAGQAKDSSKKLDNETPYDGSVEGVPSFDTFVAKLTSNICGLGNSPVQEILTSINSNISHTALKFNGSTDYIQVPYSSALNPGEFTVSLWAKVEGGQGHRSPLTSRDDFHQRGYIFYADRAVGICIWEGQWLGRYFGF